jgi:hypothetical protein
VFDDFRQRIRPAVHPTRAAKPPAGFERATSQMCSILHRRSPVSASSVRMTRYHPPLFTAAMVTAARSAPTGTTPHPGGADDLNLL